MTSPIFTRLGEGRHMFHAFHEEGYGVGGEVRMRADGRSWVAALFHPDGRVICYESPNSRNAAVEVVLAKIWGEA